LALAWTDPQSRIKVWTSATKGEGNEVSLPATYATPGDLPETLCRGCLAERALLSVR